MSGRGLGTRFALAVVAIAATLAAAEIGLRLSESGDDGLRALHEPRPDRPWLYGLRAGAAAEIDGIAYSVNADGFRGPLFERPKPDGVFRVVVLGDSLTFGYGVGADDVYTELLARQLAGDATIEIVNLGVGGYNPFNEAALFAGVGAAYEPDLVLAQFCVNDLNDPTLHFDANTRLALGELPDAAFPAPDTRREPSALCERFALCRRLEPILDPSEHEARVKGALSLRFSSSDSAEWRWLEARYAEIAAAAAQTGARFGILAFPHGAQIDGAGEELQQELRAMGERNGWPVIDLLPAFRAATAETDGALFFDLWHPTAAGHDVAAEATARALRCQDLVPGPRPDACDP